MLLPILLYAKSVSYWLKTTPTDLPKELTARHTDLFLVFKESNKPAMSPKFDQIQAFGGVIDVLEAIGAVHALWGGIAVVAHDEPRFTQDMDVLLSPEKFTVSLFVRRLQEAHYHVDEIAVQRALSGSFFNVIHLYYHIKIDFYIPIEPELRAMIAERTYLPFDEMCRAAYIPPPDSAVIAKLRAYADSQSLRYLDDIASIVRVQGGKLYCQRP
ncbi:MAG: hypothetical protein HND44_09230 [Chloroflexi bacterium]|nr:hypothetical protein [Ardenticatenaceae bacterium]MBL1128663.1 hypothetical protein [Chloroflexota bacterium]NOG34741.1 hypothetical protein [Chloroflexota bacterium]GIK55048.1 MAG: hypothetical protein BroJett015_07110 [Chloroflexota bacterium]